MSESNIPNDKKSKSAEESELNQGNSVSDEKLLPEESSGSSDIDDVEVSSFEEPEPSPPDEPLTSSTEPSVPVPNVTPPKKSAKSLLLATMVLLVFVGGGVGVAGFLGWQLQQTLDDQMAGLSQKVLANQAAISSAKSSIDSTKSSIDAVESSVNDQSNATRDQLKAQIESQLDSAGKSFRSLSNKQQQQVDMLQKRIDGHQQRLLSLSTTSREDWMLAEAEYLLKLANQRVLLERTTENAVALLEAADQLVAQVSAGTGDAELFAIRKAISRDLTALKLIKSVDKDGIYLELQALAERIDLLPRVPDHTFVNAVSSRYEAMSAEGENKDAVDSSEVGGNSVLDRVWFELKGMAGTLNQYIKIEDAVAPAKPLVDQNFTEVAGLNVRLLLEQAQIALLKESPIIYSNSLNQAHELIGRYYIPSQQATEFQEAILKLNTVDVAPTLPDISKSLQLLHGYLRLLHKLQDTAEGQL